MAATTEIKALATDQDVSDEHILQRELVKITVIKGKIIRAFASHSTVSDNTIAGFRQEMTELKEQLPQWISMTALLDSNEQHPA